MTTKPATPLTPAALATRYIEGLGLLQAAEKLRYLTEKAGIYAPQNLDALRSAHAIVLSDAGWEEVGKLYHQDAIADADPITQEIYGARTSAL